MRVVLDALWWGGGPPSGRSVARDLLGTWVQEFPEDKVVAVTRPADGPSVAGTYPGLEVVTTVSGRLPHSLALYKVRRIAEGADLVLTHNFGVGALRCPSVVFVYDTIFVRHPEWFTRQERLYLSTMRRRLRHVSHIVTAAESEVSEISRVWPEVGDRLSAVGLGVPSELLEAVPTPIGGLRDGFVLSVGRFNVRKNLERLVAAWKRSTLHQATDLVIVGPRSGITPELEGDLEAASIKILGAVRSEELAWLYGNAAMLVFPSLDEGYGLPIAEARAFALPAVVSDIPPFREFGYASHYFDPLDANSMAHILDLAYRSAVSGARPPVSAARRDDWPAVVRALRSLGGRTEEVVS